MGYVIGKEKYQEKQHHEFADHRIEEASNEKHGIDGCDQGDGGNADRL